ncbi:subtilisin-like protein [Decorospora gaudefroyi]|uniref:Subtilisin-like protein n=1 Tax=Decorospora gaudefroyi TaxID=184978 RepID=A0A6A5K393_9PLEO|nr:subtilisin-like protein [Decorospora gaudefroyi]
MHAPVLFALVACVIAAPLIRVRSADAVTGKWIVKLKGDISSLAEEDLQTSLSTKPDFRYSMDGFRGFAGTLSDEEITRLQASDRIEYIQQDAKVYKSSFVEQGNATWGLARISHTRPGSATYLYDSTAGAGTCAYVIDSGIEIDHPEFQGRASFLADFSGENSTMDGDGHGTHVAGTIGSLTWGVAKKTELLAVRVLDSLGWGTNAGVIAGMQFAIEDAKARREAGKCPKGFVANMSLGGFFVKAVNDGAAAVVRSGIFLAVAAGNEAMDAEYSSPASEPTVCTVGATAKNDTLAWWSNYGPLVDILAPGVDITSTYIGHTIGVDSGTSMATPHVVGLAAYMLGLDMAPVETLCEMIAQSATKDAIAEDALPPSTPNLLAYNIAEGMIYGKRRL